jgi:hypothetical protein
MADRDRPPAYAVQAAAERLLTDDPDPFDEPRWAALLALVREAVEQLGWGTMTYACDTCPFEWAVWLSLGVEGPPALRKAGLYIAAPFMLSRCPAWPQMQPCGGRMKHVRWDGDQEFEPQPIPDDAPRFVLPHSLSAAGEGARLEIPTPALVRARRVLNEEADDAG